MENILKERYEDRCKSISDINEHLPTLYEYALRCDHITEMGVRRGVSTSSFLYANPKKFIAYDIRENGEVRNIFDMCLNNGKDFHYIIDNVLEVTIEETDFLFIDTEHTYDQLSQELKLHANKVRKYIGFHDTVIYGEQLMKAINEFLDMNGEWKIVHDAKYNNGMVIIEKN